MTPWTNISTAVGIPCSFTRGPSRNVEAKSVSIAMFRAYLASASSAVYAWGPAHAGSKDQPTQSKSLVCPDLLLKQMMFVYVSACGKKCAGTCVRIWGYTYAYCMLRATYSERGFNHGSILFRDYVEVWLAAAVVTCDLKPIMQQGCGNHGEHPKEIRTKTLPLCFLQLIPTNRLFNNFEAVS